MSPRHREALGSEFDRVARQGEVEVLQAWTNAITGRPTAISNARLQQLAQECLPTGDAVQYEINRMPEGWILELINNQGVIKKRDQPAIIDPATVARVRLKCKPPFKSATELRSNRVHEKPGVLNLDLGPGAIEFVEFHF
jgi:hypothetical protein